MSAAEAAACRGSLNKSRVPPTVLSKPENTTPAFLYTVSGNQRRFNANRAKRTSSKVSAVGTLSVMVVEKEYGGGSVPKRLLLSKDSQKINHGLLAAQLLGGT